VCQSMSVLWATDPFVLEAASAFEALPHHTAAILMRHASDLTNMGQPLGQDVLSWNKDFQETMTSSGVGVSR
jgi:hypothetical protein